jgi:uncharacterized protein YjbJ (UPF0337 family)
MNWSEIEVQWEPMRGLLVSYWNKLSDDDLARIDGKRDGLAQVIRERYGLNDTEAEDAICAFEKDVRRPGAVK